MFYYYKECSRAISNVGWDVYLLVSKLGPCTVRGSSGKHLVDAIRYSTLFFTEWSFQVIIKTTPDRKIKTPWWITPPLLKAGCDFVWILVFFRKKTKNLKPLNEYISANNNRKCMRSSAFESLHITLSQNYKIFFPASYPFDFCYHWGRIFLANSQKSSNLWVFIIFATCSMVAKNAPWDACKRVSELGNR